MSSSVSLLARTGADQPLALDEECRLSVRSLTDIGDTLTRVLGALAAAGFDERDRFHVRLALEEALVNAIRHGHQGDQTKEVSLRFDVDSYRFVAEIEDQGPGFDPLAVADPRTPANRERPGGRGVFLMCQVMDVVRFNSRGNRVTLCKFRSSRAGLGRPPDQGDVCS